MIPEAPRRPGVSRPGDLWLLGPHRLLCGDATVITDVDRLMAGAKADLCFTDSPYNVDYAGGVGAEKAGKGRRILNDALGDGFERFLYDACVSIIAHTAGAIYMCMSSSELHTLQKAFVAAGGHWSTFDHLGEGPRSRSGAPTTSGSSSRSSTAGRRARSTTGAAPRDQGDVWFIDRPARNDLHPTMKPVGARRAGDPQLEPARRVWYSTRSAAAARTLIAAEATGRGASSRWSIRPAYVDVIVERWQAETGRDAMLDGDGRSFAAVKAERLGADAEPRLPKRSRKSAAA